MAVSPAPLQESSNRGCSAKHVEIGSAYAFSLISIFLSWRLYSHLCLIASDGFLFQEFVQLLSGFRAVSLNSLLWWYVPEERNIPWKSTTTSV